MPSGTVRAEQDRPLKIQPVGDWRPGGTAVDFRAAVIRARRLYGVRVKVVSQDRSTVFVKFSDGCTGWVPVDDLREG